jgi:disulfide bond formation protein DsbB
VIPRSTVLAFLIPCAALGAAWGAQLIGHLYPCEMCHWQRWPHYAALVIAGFALFVGRPGRRALTIVAALLIAVSGAIGVFHAGVEYGWWPGLTGCTSTIDFTAGSSAADRLKAIMNAPMVRCDVAQWTFLGVSLAGMNAILSLGGAAAVLAVMRRER